MLRKIYKNILNNIRKTTLCRQLHSKSTISLEQYVPTLGQGSCEIPRSYFRQGPGTTNQNNSQGFYNQGEFAMQRHALWAAQGKGKQLRY